jgi:hypothetical protein
MTDLRNVSPSPEHLVEVAVKGLPQMFDKATGLYCHRVIRADGKLVQEGISHRYTMMTLLGLNRLECAAGTSPVATAPILDRLLNDLGWVNNIGDLGLLVWMCGEMAPDRLSWLNQQLRITTALERYPDAKNGLTMSLAWYLTGLCQWALAIPDQASSLEQAALATYRKLKVNQGRHGIFGHLARNSGFRGRALGWMGTFADQVYPIIAFSKYSAAFHRSAVQDAQSCARAICDAQGPLGQWCWHYDSRSGLVTEAYPVFSVHQHAMGPMALFALEEATGTDFTPWVSKGIEWITVNELNFDMEDRSTNLIWRCTGRPRLKRTLDLLFNGGMKAAHTGSSSDFRVLFECRPYELGWLLYALAGWREMSRKPYEGIVRGEAGEPSAQEHFGYRFSSK